MDSVAEKHGNIRIKCVGGFRFEEMVDMKMEMCWRILLLKNVLEDSVTEKWVDMKMEMCWWILLLKNGWI